MTVPTTRNASQQVALHDHKSMNRQLRQVAEWVGGVPDLTGPFPIYQSLGGAIKQKLAEIEALTATDGYKQAIAMLAPLTAPPPVGFVSDLILALIASKPFGHMVAPECVDLMIDDIGDMDPPPSIAAVLTAFLEMRLTPGPNVPDIGTMIQCIAAAEERFRAKYRPLLQLEERGRQLAVQLTEITQEERDKADPIKRAVESAQRQASLEKWQKMFEERKKKRDEEERQKLKEDQQKLQQIVASGRLDTLQSDLREAHREVLKDQSTEKAQRVIDLLRELSAIERLAGVNWISHNVEVRFKNVREALGVVRPSAMGSPGPHHL